MHSYVNFTQKTIFSKQFEFSWKVMKKWHPEIIFDPTFLYENSIDLSYLWSQPILQNIKNSIKLVPGKTNVRFHDFFCIFRDNKHQIVLTSTPHGVPLMHRNYCWGLHLLNSHIKDLPPSCILNLQRLLSRTDTREGAQHSSRSKASDMSFSITFHGGNESKLILMW